MKKSDAIITAIVGFISGIIFYGISRVTEITVPYVWLLPIIFPPFGVLAMFIASLIGKRFLIALQAARFFLVGALNTFIDLGILNGLIWISGIAAGPFYSVFKGVSFLAATLNSYFWNKHWTFEKRKRVFAPREFSKFLVVTAVGLSINVGIASIVVNIIGPQFGITDKMWATVGAFTATLFAWVWNFIGSKFIVFKV